MHPLSNGAATKLIKTIVRNGTVSFTGHARRELANDGLTITDAVKVLQGGFVEFSEPVRDAWRYRVVVGRTWVVVELDGDSALVVVTGWRKR